LFLHYSFSTACSIPLHVLGKLAPQASIKGWNAFHNSFQNVAIFIPSTNHMYNKHRVRNSMHSHNNVVDGRSCPVPISNVTFPLVDHYWVTPIVDSGRWR